MRTLVALTLKKKMEIYQLTLRPGGGHHGSPRCGLNQRLTLDQIESLLAPAPVPARG